MLATLSLGHVTPPPPVGVTSHVWHRPALRQAIAYERAAPPTASPGKAPVLLLNGFGVGTFHWHRNMAPLAAATGSSVWGVDYLGQGGSWPLDADDGRAPSERRLRVLALGATAFARTK